MKAVRANILKLAKGKGVVRDRNRVFGGSCHRRRFHKTFVVNDSLRGRDRGLACVRAYAPASEIMPGPRFSRISGSDPGCPQLPSRTSWP